MVPRAKADGLQIPFSLPNTGDCPESEIAATRNAQPANKIEPESGLRCQLSCYTAHQFLRMDGKLGQSLHPCSVLAERVLYHAKVKAGNDHVIPSVSDSTQCNIQHGDDLIAQWLLAVESDGAKKLLALSIAGIVRAGVRLLLSEVDLLAAPSQRDRAGFQARDVRALLGRVVETTRPITCFSQLRRRLRDRPFVGCRA